MRLRLFSVFLLGVSTLCVAPPALAAQAHHQARADALNTKLSARIATIDAKLAGAARKKQVTPTQLAAMRKKIAWVRKDAAKYVKEQGFLSAGEAASYNRSLDEIEAKLG